MKNDMCDTLTDSHSILNWWKNNYQLLNVKAKGKAIPLQACRGPEGE
jgi:hypothetical protein